MKKIFSACAILFVLSINANAQYLKGDYLLGGNANLVFQSKSTLYSGNKYSAFSLSGGKAIKSDVLIGLKYNHYNSFSAYDYMGVMRNIRTTTDDYGVFARKNWHLRGKLYGFLEGELGYRREWLGATHYDNGVVSQYYSNQRGIYTAFTPGIMYKMNNRVSFELSFPGIVGFSSTGGGNTFQGGYMKQRINSFNTSLRGTSNTGLISLGVKIKL